MLSSHVEVRVENTVEVRDSLHRLSDHAYRMALSAASHEKREACLAIAAAIKIALEPEQLTEGDVRTPRELRDARDVED